MTTLGHRVRGFTLIELLVTLAIGILLMATAIPSLTTYRRNAELTSAANTLMAAINAARGEAMKRGMNAMVVPADSGIDWNTGWIVFVDKNNTKTYNGDPDTTILRQPAMSSTLRVTGNGTAGLAPSYILFDASGYSKTKGGAFGSLTLAIVRNDVSGPNVFDQTRRIKIASTGRVRVCKPVDATDVNCQNSIVND